MSNRQLQYYHDLIQGIMIHKLNSTKLQSKSKIYTYLKIYPKLTNIQNMAKTRLLYMYRCMYR